MLLELLHHPALPRVAPGFLSSLPPLLPLTALRCCPTALSLDPLLPTAYQHSHRGEHGDDNDDSHESLHVLVLPG